MAETLMFAVAWVWSLWSYAKGVSNTQFWGNKKERIILRVSSAHLTLGELSLPHDDWWPKMQSRCSRDLIAQAQTGEIWKLPCQGLRNVPLKNLWDEHEVELIFGSCNQTITLKSSKYYLLIGSPDAFSMRWHYSRPFYWIDIYQLCEKHMRAPLGGTTCLGEWYI